MVLLDTHTWLWANNEAERLSEAASQSIGEAAQIAVASISCWELGMLAAKGRLEFDEGVRTWIRKAIARPQVVVLALSAEIAVEAALIDAAFGADPADRIIYATARNRGLPLITRDRRIQAYDPRGTIW